MANQSNSFSDDIDLHELGNYFRKVRISPSLQRLRLEDRPFDRLDLWLSRPNDSEPIAGIQISIVEGDLVVLVDGENNNEEKALVLKLKIFDS